VDILGDVTLEPDEYFFVNLTKPTNVLVSVPGSPQAREAVIANSIPQTASISRTEAKLTVVYLNGGPSFMPIAGTSLISTAKDARRFTMARTSPIWWPNGSPNWEASRTSILTG